MFGMVKLLKKIIEQNEIIIKQNERLNETPKPINEAAYASYRNADGLYTRNRLDKEE